jgi:hypothetical protein
VTFDPIGHGIVSHLILNIVKFPLELSNKIINRRQFDIFRPQSNRFPLPIVRIKPGLFFAMQLENLLMPRGLSLLIRLTLTARRLIGRLNKLWC